MSEPAGSSRRTRAKGPEATGRSAALERLKALRNPGGRRSESGFQIKMEEPIYDTVEEEAYAAIVDRRREEARGFIVDDDGLGYNDEGEEEDWSHPAYSSQEEASDDDGNEKSKKKSASKKDPAVKKIPPSSLTAAAALMGKQRISSMFTSSVFKKNDRMKGSGLSSESIVNDVLAEIVPDERDREVRRRRSTVQLARSSRVQTVVQIKNEASPSPVDRPVEVHRKPEREVQDNAGLGQNEYDMTEVKEEMAVDIEVKQVDSGSLEEEDRADASEKMETETEALKCQKSENGSSISAKIKMEGIVPLPSATAGWKEVRGKNGNADCDGRAPASNAETDENPEFPLDSDGSFPFYIIDAYEEPFGANSGTLYLFGKVKAGSVYHSCCVVVKNMQRCIYAFPNGSVFESHKLMEIEKKVADSHISATEFRSTLQEMASGLKNEIATKLLDLNVSAFSMMPVKRGYAFERSDIPRGEQYVLKINYPFKDPPLPLDLKGEHFLALLGTQSSALELFLIKRKIMGPSWLTISRFVSCPASQRISWCKFEVVVDRPKDISISNSKILLAIPPVIVAAINLKTIISQKHNVNEIVSASVICCHNTKIDSPMLASEWKRKGALTHFTVIRKLEGGIFPMGLSKEATDRNIKAGSKVLALESSERALLNRLMIELHKLDCDVLVGHNISGFDLDVLLHRAQNCKVPSSMWSKIGRLKRSVIPKLTKGSSLYGSGASLGIMSCIAGRLLCDTYLCSRDLLKEVSYSLTQLAKTQLNKVRKEVSPHDIPAMFQTSETLLELVEYGETDAWLSLELMFYLSVLPLTRQLTNISGNLWGKTLQGARAQRVEYLLLHAFHGKKFILPDKISARSKELNSTKRRISSVVDSGDADDLNANESSFENCGQLADHGKAKRGPSYAGGLVLEPKKGLYDKYVLLLDFNSLYPSIIQEYNICFTTVEQSADGLVPNLPSSKTTGVLPELLKNLVDRRKLVKSWLKNASGLDAQQFDIQQQALKLTANSMYGCLGFSNSRFYAKSLAELITLQGREILQSTVDLVQNNLNLEVIYGDTDSIMIYSGLDDIPKAKAIAGKVIQEVNKKYCCLEIDLDGLYKRMLLLKKKKYAAVKVLFKDGAPYEVIERKGLDMVRRDWSLISKEIGDFCLNQILSGGTCEEDVESIHNSLMKVQEDMRKDKIPPEKYVITKTLTKPPEEYPDAKNQPHVQVALRLKQNGYLDCSAGDTISYIICCHQDTGTGSYGVAQRARHLDELKGGNSSWVIDIDYYLSQQIHPVVSRLCASIQGTSPARLADCLGLDSSKFQIRTLESDSKDPSTVLLSVVDDDERYRGCESLRVSCPSCSSTFDCPPVSSLLSISINGSTSDPQKEKDNFWYKMRCPRCPADIDGSIISAAIIANQVKRQAENFISLYYKGLMTCDDEVCKYTTRNLNLRVIGDYERGTICPNYPRCNGHLIRQYTEADLYKQLSYFCYVLDARRCIEKLDKSKRLQFEKDLAVVCQTVDQAASLIKKIRDRCAYGWVQLNDLCVSV